MLVARAVQRIIDKRELIVRAAQTPDDLARVPVDLRHFAGTAAGKEDVTVGININGVHVRKIKTAPCDIYEILLA